MNCTRLAHAAAAPDQAAVLAFLRAPAAHADYAGGSAPVEMTETHMSWVFLVGEHVLKLKKPVRYAFLDFSTPAARETSCREELRLNARLAPGVYHGLMALQWDAGRLALVPDGPAIDRSRTVDWLVWMRRLPAARMLDRAIAQDQVTHADIDALVGVLAAFYRGAPAIELDPPAYVARLQHEQALNRELLLQPRFALAAAAPLLDRLDLGLQRWHGALCERVAGGGVVDGHGDLRPEHVCLLQPPVIIDCLEFNQALRQVDPFDELVFLGLECELAGAAWIGPLLVAGCARVLVPPPPALLHLYTAYRALLRARLATAHLLDAQPRLPQRWLPLAGRYLQRAGRALDQLDPISAASPGSKR